MEDDREAKFAHLLKPIKDLAENWDIDIASELLEYLDDLDKVVVNFEEGDLNLNFAEAALVIQGSTVVYSKKVEFLYNLVFRTLELLCESYDKSVGQNQDQSGDGRKKRRKSLVEISFNEKENFLLLDDVIPFGKNISLKDMDREQQLQENMETTQQNLRERIPFALVSGRTNLSESASAFRMMSCNVDTSGGFVLDRQQASSSSIEEESQQAMFEGGNDYDDGGDSYMGDGGGMNYDDEEDLYAPGGGGGGMDLYASPDSNGEHQHPATTPRKHHEDEEEQNPMMEDPWARLDPHEKGGEEDNVPLKVGKPWKIPSKLKKKNMAANKSNNKKLSYKNLLVSVALNPKLASKVPVNANMVFYPEFRDYAKQRRKLLRESGILPPAIFGKQSNQQPKTSRHVVAKHGKGGDDDDEEEENAIVFGSDDERDDEQQGDGLGPSNNNGGNEDEDDDMYYGDGGGDYFDYDQDQEEPSNRIDLDAAVFDRSAETYVDMVRSHLQKYLETANQWVSESKLHARVRTWEEKIEPILHEQNKRPQFDIHLYGERLLSGLGEETVTFDELSASIGTLALKPRSDENGDEEEDDDNDDEFDNDPTRATTTLPQLDRYEVCRMFLASLQLANNGNVELYHETNNSELRVKLLDNVLANRKLENYLAPSAAQEKSQDAEFETTEKNKRKTKRAKRVPPGGQENIVEM